MEQIVRVVDVREKGAVAAVQDLLWWLMENDVVQGLLVPLQTHPNEAPAPLRFAGALQEGLGRCGAIFGSRPRRCVLDCGGKQRATPLFAGYCSGLV